MKTFSEHLTSSVTKFHPNWSLQPLILISENGLNLLFVIRAQSLRMSVNFLTCKRRSWFGKYNAEFSYFLRFFYRLVSVPMRALNRTCLGGHDKILNSKLSNHRVRGKWYRGSSDSHRADISIRSKWISTLSPQHNCSGIVVIIHQSLLLNVRALPGLVYQHIREPVTQQPVMWWLEDSN